MSENRRCFGAPWSHCGGGRAVCVCVTFGWAEGTPRPVPCVGLWVPHTSLGRLRACLSSSQGWSCGCPEPQAGETVWVCVDVGAQFVPGDAGLFSSGDQSDHKLALKNIASMVRPGGVLVIDHRNYDHILATGCAPPGKNIYYKVGGCHPCPIPLPSATTPFPRLGPGTAEHQHSAVPRAT